jgi:hypothetical protein
MSYPGILEYAFAIAGVVFALPGAIFVAWGTTSRWRILGALSGFAGAVAGFFIGLFIWFVPLQTTRIDPLTLTLVFFLLCSITGLVGGLAFNFFFNGSQQPPRGTQVEF